LTLIKCELEVSQPETVIETLVVVAVFIQNVFTVWSGLSAVENPGYFECKSVCPGGMSIICVDVVYVFKESGTDGAIG
jgi:hypothetical protein